MLKGITRRYKWNILLTISEWNAQRLGSDAENTSQIILKFPNLELIISLQCKNIFLQYSQHTLLMERSNVKKNKQFSKALALKKWIQKCIWDLVCLLYIRITCIWNGESNTWYAIRRQILSNSILEWNKEKDCTLFTQANPKFSSILYRRFRTYLSCHVNMVRFMK